MHASSEQDWLQIIFDNISDAIVVIDGNGIIRYANDIAARMAGYATIQQLLNIPYEAILEERQLYDEAGNSLSHLSLPNVVSFDTGLATRDRIIRQVNSRDGTQLWLSVSTAPVLDEGGTVRFVIIFYRDISERKSRDDKLWFMVQSEKILSATPDFDLRLSEKAKLIVPVLADWCTINIVGEDGSLSRIVVVHRDPSKTLLLERYAALAAADPSTSRGIHQVIRTGIPEFYPSLADEHLSDDASDDERLELSRLLAPRSAMIVPIIANSKVLGVLSLSYAESDRRFSQEDLEFMQEFCYHLGVLVENSRLYRQIAQRDASKDAFLAALSHELRNPLAPIRSSLELLHLQNQDPAVSEQIAIIEHQFDGMTRILSDLLDVTRYSQGKVTLERTLVDARSLIERVVKSNLAFLSKRDIALHVSLPPDPVRIIADGTRIEQALTNILHNAEKFTSPHGNVWIELTSDGVQAKISIRDDGVGIEAADLARIFDRNFQSARNRERQNSGLGLGLVLVREIVGLHGGTIEAQSDGGDRGSCFSIRLPLARDDPGHEHVRAAVPESPSRRKILIADDNVAAAEGLKKLLSHRGHAVETVGAGVPALDLARSFMPDVMLLDIGLPDLDGYEVARRFRSEFGSRTTLVALTGYGQDEDKRKASAAGFDHHLTKPAGIREIEAILSLSPVPEPVLSQL